MRTTEQRRPAWDVLQPRSLLVFGAVVLAWIAIAQLPDWEAYSLRAAARLAGYGAFIAMLVPYLHIVRRAFRYRQGAAMRSWLRWHIVAAYVAFFMVLIHSRGRANSLLTSALVWLTWIVMVSGVIGYYGQKLLYYFLPRMVPDELGLERLEPQRAHVLQAAEKLVKKAESLAKKNPAKPIPEVIQSFFQAVEKDFLARPLTFWSWLWTRRPAGETLSSNWYERALHYAEVEQQKTLKDLWQLVEERRALDLEYRLHQLGRLWLIVHGPAAWALLVLMIEHAAFSMWYGGF